MNGDEIRRRFLEEYPTCKLPQFTVNIMNRLDPRTFERTDIFMNLVVFRNEGVAVIIRCNSISGFGSYNIPSGAFYFHLGPGYLTIVPKERIEELTLLINSILGSGRMYVVYRVNAELQELDYWSSNFETYNDMASRYAGTRVLQISRKKNLTFVIRNKNVPLGALRKPLLIPGFKF